MEKLSMLLVGVWIVLVTVSQYFLNWFQFGKTGLVVTGAIGLVGAVLWLYTGFTKP
jgi:hypothetical protein